MTENETLMEFVRQGLHLWSFLMSIYDSRHNNNNNINFVKISFDVVMWTKDHV